MHASEVGMTYKEAVDIQSSRVLGKKKKQIQEEDNDDEEAKVSFFSYWFSRKWKKLNYIFYLTNK